VVRPETDTARAPRRPSWQRVVAFNAILILGVWVLAEGAVRVRQTFKYGTPATVEDYYTDDPLTGLRVPIANLSKGHISVNSRGFRGPEIAMPKPPGTVRIAFLGASTTWCAEVSGNDSTWPHLVTTSLARALPAVRFDYVNAGVPGFAMHSIRKNLELRVAPLEPDVIVIYEASNDLSREMRELAARAGLIDEARMHELTWPSRYSLLWRLAEKNLRVMAAQRATSDPTRRLSARPASLGAEYRRDLTEVMREAQRTAKLVALATVSTQLRHEQTPEQQAQAMSSASFYMPFVTAPLLLDAFERYNDIGRQVAAEAGVVLIDGADEIPGDPAHFTDTVHFTDAGSRAMADRLTRALRGNPAFQAVVDAAQSTPDRPATPTLTAVHTPEAPVRPR
jgi:lysophospholipase L1-like esterase